MKCGLNVDVLNFCMEILFYVVVKFGFIGFIDVLIKLGGNVNVKSY